MKKFTKLNRAEMKEVLGGFLPPAGGGCADQCKSDAQCLTGQVCQTGDSTLCPNRKECVAGFPAE